MIQCKGEMVQVHKGAEVQYSTGRGKSRWDHVITGRNSGYRRPGRPNWRRVAAAKEARAQTEKEKRRKLRAKAAAQKAAEKELENTKEAWQREAASLKASWETEMEARREMRIQF